MLGLIKFSLKTNMNKVVLRVWGGIGNQMFIYAFARFLSIKYKKTISVFLEIYSGFSNDAYGRVYRLNNFDTKITIGKRLFLLIVFILRRIPFLAKRISTHCKLLIEDETTTFSKIEKIICNTKYTYLEGYWQTINFNDIRDVLLSEFTFKLDDNPIYFRIENQITNTNSVAIHIRRILYDTISFDYYIKAISFMQNHIPDCIFYVFSDDIDYCKRQIGNSKQFVFIENLPNEMFDLKLMSLCKHFIIANSSFSWWGAWLSISKDKIVIMPREYLNDNMTGTVLCF